MNQFDNINWRRIKRKGPHNDGVYVDSDMKYVKLYPGNGRRIKAERVYNGTLKALSIFKKYDITPKYISSEIINNEKDDKFTGYIIMTYVGSPLKKSNIPDDAIQQVENIENILRNTTGEFLNSSGKYYHNDIDIRNLMVLDSKIRLIDLGLTSFGKRAGLGKNSFRHIKRQVERLYV